MDLETRVKNLEDMMASIVNTISNSQFYTNADIAGVRKDVAEVTPYKETRKAYIDDTQIIFDNVPSGNLTVYMDGGYTIEREDNRVIIMFEPLKEVKDVTISVI